MQSNYGSERVCVVPYTMKTSHFQGTINDDSLMMMTLAKCESWSAGLKPCATTITKTVKRWRSMLTFVHSSPPPPNHHHHHHHK